MFYENRLSNQAETFRTAYGNRAFEPTRGIIEKKKVNNIIVWTTTVQCDERPHHNDSTCQNIPHWLATDPAESQSDAGQQVTRTAVQEPLPRIPPDSNVIDDEDDDDDTDDDDTDGNNGDTDDDDDDDTDGSNNGGNNNGGNNNGGDNNGGNNGGGNNNQGTGNNNGNGNNGGSPTPTIPSAPSNLRLSSKTTSQAVLLWDTPSDDGGGITDYKYRYQQSSSGSWGTWIDWVSAGVSDLTETVTGLTSGSSYRFEVCASNSAGDSPSSNQLVVFIPAPLPPPPPVPTGVSASGGNGQVTLTWTESTSATSYEYSRTTIVSPAPSDWSLWESMGSSQTSHTVSNLTNGTTYYFQLRARNAGGASVGSLVVSATPMPPVVPPSAPQNLIGAAGNTLVTLAWDAPADDGGGTISGYEYKSRITGSTWSNWGTSWSLITPTWTSITGLTNETTYDFEVRAKNSAGGSAAASITLMPTAKRRPYQPSNLVATAGDGQVTLSWDAPGTITTDAPVDNYEYRLRENNTGDWGSWTSTGSTNTTFTVTSLTNGTLYGFQVHAVNSYGTSALTSTATATPVSAASVPSAPQSFDLDRGSTAGTLTISWSAPLNNGGAAITDYEYQHYHYDASTRQWTNWSEWYSVGNSTATTYTITGLTTDVVYVVRMRAKNSAGGGDTTSIRLAGAR